MSTVKRPRLSLFSIAFDLLIDLALITMGALLYYHFMIVPLGPFDISPAVTEFLGVSRRVAILLMAGVPAFVGIVNLLRTVYRVIIHMFRREKPPESS